MLLAMTHAAPILDVEFLFEKRHVVPAPGKQEERNRKERVGEGMDRGCILSCEAVVLVGELVVEESRLDDGLSYDVVDYLSFTWACPSRRVWWVS